MTLQFLNPTDVHAPGGYSHAITVSGRLLIVAGQIGLDRERNVVGGGDFEAQAVQVFENLKTVLNSGGARMEDVVRLGVFLEDRKYLPQFREVRARYFPGALPTSTLVIAGLVMPELLLEVEAIAQMPA